ncbi:hypothetical protein BB8028_0004g11870 [Beauveria bassiana]|uniref:GATA-type domain-containing protein n=1 Tax=Beauveria bassiana TaxID=176275 RepID=A0A2S7YDS7_BEABA|nr:hypothetical protein BB8028_0004g11870 [Beauveria bassiana]
MSLQEKKARLEIQAPRLPEQYTVGRLRVGETLQKIRGTAQDLYNFQDNIGGRSALVHGSQSGEAQDVDGHQRHDMTKLPRETSHDSSKSRSSDKSLHGSSKSRYSSESHRGSLCSDESRRLKLSRRQSGASFGCGGPSSQQQQFRRFLRTADISCHQCGEIKTPEWRPGPEGPGTLCNVCGLIYAKHASQRRHDKLKSDQTKSCLTA